MNAIICNFSGALADLKKRHRSTVGALRVLRQSPRVSAFDMSELPWMRNLLKDLERSGLIEECKGEHYPWLRFKITDAGQAELERTKGLPA
jgi:hypothetical protein